ncbi:hypothetical protein [Sphingomonas sp. BK235]|uniref:hypothetical protein n=1 Tax=Sphingomonas sp. BK235 TaxID=2512131 RepID=UPI0010DA08DF|nr:hypothetical protein [Sphingomonas sp. BK235]TCP30362.1 hypothetical protein EV292_11335 [Sphingomonas sp. BK235]
MLDLAAAPTRPPPAAQPSTAPSLWLVAALLIAHQAALTVIHYIVGPAMGLDPASER